jgi:hypothetical protein
MDEDLLEAKQVSEGVPVAQPPAALHAGSRRGISHHGLLPTHFIEAKAFVCVGIT